MINIYGKGGHARMIASLIDAECNFYDDTDYQLADENPWLVGIGNNSDRKKVTEKLIEQGCQVLTIDLGLYVSTTVDIGFGSVIAPGSIIQNDVVAGNGVIVNTSASIDHDCVIGDYCHIAPNTTLCGGVKIGNGTLIGAGSVIIPGIEIGENCIIGAGSVVTKNIPDYATAFGNPATIK
jgi:sugar O-acyltransferase (sialic acid O-acetyltransferase NeuD family)